MNFEGFPKIARLSRPCIITEKLDGTNAQVHVRLADDTFEIGIDTQIQIQGYQAFIRAGSRTRWIGPQEDNHGFARWVYENAHELGPELGLGQHFGEWWGRGIQRGYNQVDKHFSLFNTTRWATKSLKLCRVVPILWTGNFDSGAIEDEIFKLRTTGSVAAPGFPYPEGIVIFHERSQQLFKKTIEKDEEHKGTSKL